MKALIERAPDCAMEASTADESMPAGKVGADRIIAVQPDPHSLIENIEKVVRQRVRISGNRGGLKLQRPVRFFRNRTVAYFDATSGFDLSNG